MGGVPAGIRPPVQQDRRQAPCPGDHPEPIRRGDPLIIIGYAFIEALNLRRDVGKLIVGNLHLTGSTAQIVKDTFTNASSGKSVALSISLISLLISLLITGLDVSATAQVAYARAFTMTSLRGIQKYLRAAAWLILLLAGTGAALTLRSVAASHPLWLVIVAGAVLVVLQSGSSSSGPGCCSACPSPGAI